MVQAVKTKPMTTKIAMFCFMFMSLILASQVMHGLVRLDLGAG
jgi:hypothetical protein